MDFVIREGKLLPILEIALLDERGQPVNLETASGVSFRMRRVGSGTDLFTNPAAVVDAPNGIVQYVWSEGDTDDSGTYEAEFIVTTSGKEQGYPGDSDLIIEVFADDLVDPSELVFCTAAQARAIVRVDVDLNALALAQTVISMETGVEPDSTADSYYDTLDDQDQLGLRQATAFQAVWLTMQPDYLTRINVTSESGDGESRNYGPNALTLAPLATWALRNTRFASGGDLSIDTPRDRSLFAEQIPTGGWIPWVTGSGRRYGR